MFKLTDKRKDKGAKTALPRHLYVTSLLVC